MTKKQIVERYLDGFRTGEQAKILSCLADKIVWRLHGCQTFIGKEAFEANITNEEFREIPIFEVRELIEEGNIVVAVGSGALNDTTENSQKFVFTEVFLFEANQVIEVDTFHIWTD